MLEGRWIDRVGETPGGLIGAWFNVLICAGILLTLPTIMLLQLDLPWNLFAGAAALAVSSFLEFTFIRNLHTRLVYRVSAGDADESPDAEDKLQKESNDS